MMVNGIINEGMAVEGFVGFNNQGVGIFNVLLCLANGSFGDLHNFCDIENSDEVVKFQRIRI